MKASNAMSTKSTLVKPGTILNLKAIQAATEQAYANSDWKEQLIIECNEPLVPVHADHAYPWYYHEMKLATSPQVYLRESVYKMFLEARHYLLQLGFDLKIYDGWRSVELQETLFWYYLQQFTVASFNLQDQFIDCKTTVQIKDRFLSLPSTLQAELKEANRQYVSWPSTNRRCPSPHATGGSIDVWLYRDGKPADLGVPFDWMETNASAFYHMGA